MARFLSFFVAVAIVSIAAHANALVMCAHKTATGQVSQGANIKLRNACRSSEVQVDPVALNLQGPQGPPGSDGQPGQQGVPGPTQGCVLRLSCEGTGLTDRGMVGVIM